MQPSDNTPAVSVVIPTFNPQYFIAARENVFNQAYTQPEILICDDCHIWVIKALINEVIPPEPENDGLSLENPEELGGLSAPRMDTA